MGNRGYKICRTFYGVRWVDFRFCSINTEGFLRTFSKCVVFKIDTSACTYVRMGRNPCIFMGEIEHPKVNTHSDVSFRRPFLDENPEIDGKRRAFLKSRDKNA